MIVISNRIDCRGLYDPWPLWLMKKALDRMRSGEILELITDDPSSELDMPAWSRLTGHPILEVFSRDQLYSYYIQKM